MRYLNKIIFINSASVKYAEIGLDGNVHLIGTQGVGKSTLLRAILFFYNANKIKLGISREKKSFDNYYFEYQNSYIIYEAVKDNIPFCVLAYKVNGKVAYRFFNSAYKKEFFIDENGRAFENWEKTRNALGKDIYYTRIISNYEEYRKIIYGDNKGLNPEFRKYALVESKQYQNIPRTIQNVLLNTNLEAKFIKDTIINSLSEEEFTIDVENYSKNHLRDFETQINDIKIWFKKNNKGQIIVRNQADKIIDKYRIFNFLNREKKELARNLFSRIDHIEKEKPDLSSNYANENTKLIELLQKKEKLTQLHLKREQNIISEIDYIKKELTKADKKLLEYENLNINEIIINVDKKDALASELKTLSDEKNLLTSQFSQISQKYEALILQIQNQQQEFKNSRNAEINKIKSKFSDEKTVLYETYQKLILQIREDNNAEKERASNDVTLIIEKENIVKRKKAELKHKTFFTDDIELCKEEKKLLDDKIAKSNSVSLNATNESILARKEWELKVTEIEKIAKLKNDKEKDNLLRYSTEINTIKTKIEQSKLSLYGWLNDHIPNWENTIGKVIDEENVLFNTELNPKLVDEKASTLFGIEINLNALDNRIKTVAEYNQEIERLESDILKIQKSIVLINGDKDDSLGKLNIKFRKKLSNLKETISENDYIKTQSEEKLKKNKIELNEWLLKAKSEKETVLQNLENELEEIANERSKVQERLISVKKGISRKISVKENERDSEIKKMKEITTEKIESINTTITQKKTESNGRTQELQEKRNSELVDKGADTKRLQEIDTRIKEIEKAQEYIQEKETIVIEYKKDKRELFDNIPKFKNDKIKLEKKQSSIINEHNIEKEKLDEKYKEQNKIVQIINSKIEEFEDDLKKYNEFQKSDAFASVIEVSYEQIRKENGFKTAISIISEINDKYYKGIETFKELQQSINAFIGNFNEHNIFSFKVKLNEDIDFLDFATELKEFIEEDKIKQFEMRVNQRFAHIIQQIGNETYELMSKEAEIEKIIRKINDDFVSKNFVQAIKEMEMRIKTSSNPVVKLLIQIKEFNDENSLILGETNLFTSSDSNSKNQKAVDLLKHLVKELEKYKNSTLTLSESFDLEFRIVENDNDSGWVEKLSNVGSEGTDILVKAMINILLLNVFKDSASKTFKDFKLHCMMDEIGRLHPNNVKGILRFANERNILLINGSPTSQNATDYRYTYKLAKEQSKTDSKKYITKINRLIKVNTKALN
ncbi:MAG: ATP-binding protein [Bacteroidales bacterium]|nr:ATP-binding protein [Bacteroidales bacterium]